MDSIIVIDSITNIIKGEVNMDNTLQMHTDAIRKAEDHISQSIQEMCDDIKSVEDEILRKEQKIFASFLPVISPLKQR